MDLETEYLQELHNAAEGDDFSKANWPRLAELSRLMLIKQLKKMGYLSQSFQE
jgi:hypothetical protein